MGEITGIAWCDHTFNPWWGCVEAGPGCDNCYARAWAKRTGRAKWGKDEPRVPASEKAWRDLEKWNRAAERDGVRRKAFVASMGDMLENRRDLDPMRERLWDLIPRLHWLDLLLLTKRPEMFARLTPESWRHGAWPRNAWAGTTVENQDRANAQVPALLRAASAAPIRFLSVEPLLGPVDLRRLKSTSPYTANRLDGLTGYYDHAPDEEGLLGAWIDWVIVGGESGPKARPCQVEWVRSLRDQCKAAGVACFVKQLGSRPWQAYEGVGPMPEHLRDPKGGDPAEWPSDLRVREFPRVAGGPVCPSKEAR